MLLSAAASQLRDVGLCVAGPVARLPPELTIESTRRTADALDADVFAVLASKGHVPLPDSLQGWLTGYAFFEDGAGPGSLRAEYARVNLENRSGNLLAAYAAVGGNFLGPLVGNDGRNAFMLRDLWRCWQLIRDHEQKHHITYRYLGFTRLDMHWLAAPPPLPVMIEADNSAVWIPDGQDWDGLNDRFMLLPRRWASSYFGRWPRLLNGSLLAMVREAAGPGLLDLKFDAGPEWLLRAALRSARAPVRRFAPVAAVLCEKGSKRGRHGRCTKPWSPHGLSFKYSSEASEAHANAARLRLAGWSWHHSDAAPALHPSCFGDASIPSVSASATDVSTKEQQACCSPTAGLNGDANCWSDVYTYARCCQTDRPGIWILPSPAKARELLSTTTGAMPVCWPIVSEVQMCIRPDDLYACAASGKSQA